MVYRAQSLETLPAPMPSCWFIFAEMWLFVYNYVSADSWDGFAEKSNKKNYFLTRQWSFEIIPEISLPPCIHNRFNIYKKVLIQRHSDMLHLFFKNLRSSQTSFVQFYICSIVTSVSTAEMSSPFLVLFMHET